MKWMGYIAGLGVMRNAYKILIGKTEGKAPLWIPRHRLEFPDSMTAFQLPVFFLDLVSHCPDFSSVQ
jgi:hypothetical protein